MCLFGSRSNNSLIISRSSGRPLYLSYLILSLPGYCILKFSSSPHAFKGILNLMHMIHFAGPILLLFFLFLHLKLINLSNYITLSSKIKDT